MTWFSLPETGAVVPGGFRDARSAGDWLSKLPQANTAAMLGELSTQLAAYNAFTTSARERFKTLEIFRKSIFGVIAESRRRFENRALPLTAGEQALHTACCRLWRLYAQGYLHCLRACLDQDAGVASHAAKIVHRTLTCLRMEQGCCYAAKHAVGAECWRLMHAVYASAEALKVTDVEVSDALPRETAESTVNGLYGMAFLLHLADPYSLTYPQWGAAVRWLARWRESVVIQTQVESRASACLPLDLQGAEAILTDSRLAAREPRWLVLDAVVRKLRKRSEAVRAGESPESLKLGATLSAEACANLLETLSQRFQQPTAVASTAANDRLAGVNVEVIWGLENMYARLGGRNLNEPLPTPTYTGRLQVEQLAIFGHVVESTADRTIPAERWTVSRHAASRVELCQEVGDATTRIVLGQLMMLRTSPDRPWLLAKVSRVCERNQRVELTVSFESGAVEAVVAEQRDRVSGQTIRAAGLIQTHPEGRAQILLPIGVNFPMRPARQVDVRTETTVFGQLGQLVDRSCDHECWSLTDISGGDA